MHHLRLLGVTEVAKPAKVGHANASRVFPSTALLVCASGFALALQKLQHLLRQLVGLCHHGIACLLQNLGA